MAITKFCFIEKDANDANDIGLEGSWTSTLTPTHIEVMNNGVQGPVVVSLPGFIRIWTFTGCDFTQANYVTMVAIAKQNITYSTEYPRLNIMNAATPTFLAYNVKVMSMTDSPQGTDIINRLVDISFQERGLNPFTMVLDHDTEVSAPVTLFLDTNESVRQGLRFLQEPLQDASVPDKHSFNLQGITPLTASMSGFVAKASIDVLQILLEDQTSVGMEMEGDVFDTQSSNGLYDTNLTGATAILKSFTSDTLWTGSDLVHVTIEIQKVVT